MSSMDLECPVPWRQGTGLTPARPLLPILRRSSASHDGSPTRKLHADARTPADETMLTELECGDSTRVSDTDTGDANRSFFTEDEELCPHAEWIAKRYCDTLWLGEHHSPLAGFLDSISRATRARCSPMHTLQHLARLLKSRNEIRQRFSSPQGLASRQRLQGLLYSTEYIRSGQIPYHCGEEAAIRAALTSGPAALVGFGLLREGSSSSDELGGLSRLWLEAIEARELQLQALLILTLLRLSIEHPECAQDLSAPTKEDRAASQAEESPTDEAMSRDKTGDLGRDAIATSPQAAITKRKRKADKAQRLTGRGSIFPWQMSRPRGNTQKTSISDEAAEKGRVPDAEALSKRFEALIDALCMRTATSSGSVIISEGDKGRLQGVNGSPHGDKSQSGSQLLTPPFGTRGRLKADREDERDILQWLCCTVIEPNFSSILPRQCSFVRSRCFVPNGTISTSAATLKSNDKKRRLTREKSAKSGTDRSLSRKDGRPMPRARSTGDVIKAKDTTAGEEDASTEASRLQRSLLDEGQGNVKRLQELQAARRRSTWETREVSVRRRWDRSQSAGAGACQMGAAVDLSGSHQNNKVPTGMLAPQKSARTLTARPLVRAQSEASDIFGKQLGQIAKSAQSAPRHPLTESQVLALETPAKPVKYGTAANSEMVKAWHQSSQPSHTHDLHDVFDIGAYSGDEDEDHDLPLSPVCRGSGGLLDGLQSKSLLAHSRSLQASPSRQRTLERSVSLSSGALTAWQKQF